LPDIFVPPEQIMDTVTLYTLPGRQRKLSLRFLTWYLLKKDIQTHTHDSIEDARYALLLYKLWLGFEEEERFEEIMEEIFEAGFRTVCSVLPIPMEGLLIRHRRGSKHRKTDRHRPPFCPCSSKRDHLHHVIVATGM
jgi:hypothetical protein